MGRTRAYRRKQYQRKIRKYQNICKQNYFKLIDSNSNENTSYGIFGKGTTGKERYKDVIPRMLATTHTRCSCYLCRGSKRTPSISTIKRMKPLDEEKY